MPPVITVGPTYTKTASTIVAVWTTDISADSNLFAGSKAAIDNGVAASGTAHQCIVTGLLPNTTYSCFVTSGGTSSSTTSQTTNALDTRILVTSASNGAVTLGSSTNNFSDTQRTFLSNDNKVYVTLDDGKGIVAGTPQTPGFNVQLGQLTNETTMTGANLTLANYGNFNTFSGTDGPAGVTMTNKSSGLFGLNGNLHFFVYRQKPGSSNRYCNWIKSTNHTNSFNNFTALTTFTADGNPVTPNSPAEPVQFYDLTIGLVTPVLYAADDGTLGYNTAGNGIDGGNAYVYMTFIKDNDSTTIFMMRLPRIYFDAQNATPMQYWKGGAFPSPLDFVNDSNWSATPGDAVNIKPAPNGLIAGSGIWNQPVFVPAINSYIMSLSATYNAGNPTNWLEYSAPTPAGPWMLFFSQPNTATNAFYNGFFPFHRDVAANVATSAIAVKHLYSVAPGGGTNYQINYSTLTLLPASGAAMQQLAFYNFTTVENPLSNAGTWTVCPVYSNLKVSSSGVCEASALSTNCFMYYSGPIPLGDTGGAWPADQYVEVTIATLLLPLSDAINIFVRQSTTLNTHYRLNITASTNVSAAHQCQVLAIVNNAVAGTLSTFNMTIVSGDVIRLTVVGNVLTTTQNGTQTNTVTDAGNFVPTAGPPGISAFETIASQAVMSTFAAGANQAAAPTFSPIGGTYSGAQTVTITGPSGSTIYYTLNGTTPTRSSSSIASGATISVASSQTVQAISSKTNFADSQIAGATYTSSSSGGTGLGTSYIGSPIRYCSRVDTEAGMG